MELSFRRIGQGGGLDLSTLTDRPGTLQCARGTGRGSHVLVPAGPLTLWFCLRGAVEIDTVDGPFRLQRRGFLSLPGSAAARAVGRESADWVALAIPQSALARLARATDLRRLPEPALFPTPLPLTRPLLRALAALLRQAEAVNRMSTDILVGSLVQAAQQAQAPVQAWIERACGRSEGHRRQVVLRLLSPRNRILNEPFGVHDLDTLAAAARYSKSHFLRMFRDVFGSTPHDLLIQARMDLAKHLIANSDLAISEVAASVGYESRYAFARLFKKRVGMTASDYRQDTPPTLQHAA
jgi:AraC-like DNA-binding protein